MPLGNNPTLQFVAQVASGGIVSGTITELMGGSFSQGFTAGAVGAVAGYGMSKLAQYIEDLNARKNVLTGRVCLEKAGFDLSVDESLFAGPGASEPYHFYAAGVWTENTCFDASLGQGVKIYVKNVNVLGTTISIKPNIGQTQEQILLPQKQYTFRFYKFGAVPIHWKFCVSTYSDAFTVLYEIRSTWVPGMPREH